MPNSQRRVLPWTSLAAVLAALIAGALLPSAAVAASGYCSPSGDYCHSAKKRAGVIRLSLGTFSFRGRAGVCVTGPEDRRTCRSFRLRQRTGGVYGFDIRWSAHFPDQGRGTYRVRFRYSGATLGPRDTFRRG